MSEHRNIKNSNTNLLDFSPNLSEYYTKRLKKIMASVNGSAHSDLNNNRVAEISREIGKLNVSFGGLEYIKYKVVLNLLKDLIIQGWSIEIRNRKYFLCSPSMEKDKNAIRKQMEQEKIAQFNVPSTKNFIKRMEKDKVFKGKVINIKTLIGNKDILINNIINYKSDKTNIDFIKPYIQQADEARDKHTGYKLKDIWRYFRYTWSIPYKSTPGRNLFYLVRDSSQPNNPVIGIFALGNCVLNLNVRDNYLGWTVDAIKEKLYDKLKKNGVDVKPLLTKECECVGNIINEEITEYCERTIDSLNMYINVALSEIRYDDLVDNYELENPQMNTIKRLYDYAHELWDKQIDNKRTIGDIDLVEESSTILYTKKRAAELARLLESKLYLNMNCELNPLRRMLWLLSNESGKKSVSAALIANRKRKIGSNVMEIIVCGAIPPYNELLCGKLVSLLSCSPQVITDYENRYKYQISEISSRMKGEKIVRNSSLAFLGTTSLYYMGSSQYNRIKIKMKDNFTIQFKKLGMTEGYGSVYFSKETIEGIGEMLKIVDKGRKISNVFGEGTSPKIRLIRRGLGMLGINTTQLVKHNTPRIVYGIELAKNSKEFLTGTDTELQYYFDRDKEESIQEATNELIESWRKKWLLSRLNNSELNIIERIDSFSADELLISKLF